MDKSKTTALVNKTWDDSIVPTLVDYIRIPNKSPAFDKEWNAHGHMQRAVELIKTWCEKQPIDGMKLKVLSLKDEKGEPRTPVIFMEIPGDSKETVLLYGHLDKQPEMSGWSEGLGPWTPVRRGERLYGRGGADDGYAAFASLTAIRAVRDQKIRHARCVVLIEACEESGSFDLPAYIDHLQNEIGSPSLVVCLDSGCGNYDQLWCTTSLRGLVSGDLRVDILREGVHSGDASGIVPSSFRILRTLLSRLENEKTGEILLKDLHVTVPEARMKQAAAVAQVLGKDVHAKFPFVDGARPLATDLKELILNRTWRPTVSITGVSGIPDIGSAGNVLRPFTTFKLSVRLPPSADPGKSTQAVKALLEADPPYGAKVTFKAEQGAPGWDAPAVSPWLEESMSKASSAFFGKPSLYMGEGGTIPFMGMLGAKFPKAQFLITGLLGPSSNAHGPNEFLDIPCGKKLTACVASVLEDHCVACK